MCLEHVAWSKYLKQNTLKNKHKNPTPIEILLAHLQSLKMTVKMAAVKKEIITQKHKDL